ncbi:MAG TPA: hypothetical protein VJ276_07350 [Thermoanaerobaculia bacterium]|nr:hypothetical protein [Thermoanaerobaculia bacterium]
MLRDRAGEIEDRALEMPGNGWRAIQQSQFRRLQTALRHVREFEKQITPE